MQGQLATELRVFSELARALSGPYAPEAILDRACFEVQRAFGFERVEARPGEEAGSTESSASAGAENGRPVVTVPLQADGHHLGAIVCHGRADATELELLTAVGRVTALSMHNAHHVEELHRHDRAKSEFVSVAAHELRSPIAVLHGVASTLHLRGDDLQAEQRDRLRAALVEQTGRLSELVERLLDLSQLDAGGLRLTPTWFGVGARIAELLPNLVPDRLDDISVDVGPELELYADPYAFDRVVANLVLNALRHGQPPISIRGTGDGAVELFVEDRGLGVDPEFAPRMFEPFSRSTATRALGTHGAGLGLSIARSYAAAIGADLRYEPLEPTGAQFRLAFPAPDEHADT
jgi:two-component system, OmpR family, sensor histidine kinase MtrB